MPEIYEHMLPANNYLTIIQSAIVNRTILNLTYENPQGEASSREVEPIGLTFYSLNWHLIAWCHLRQDYRDFRTSRIQNLQTSIKPFHKKDHIELNEYLQQIELKARQTYI